MPSPTPSPPLSPDQAQAVLATQLVRLESDPRDADAWMRAADAMTVLGQPDDALHALRQAAAVRADADLFARLGHRLAQRGVRDEPEQWYRRALAVSPGHRGARVSLGYVRLQAADVDEAAACFVAVLEQQPLDADAAAGAALVLDRRGDPASGWRLLQQVVSHHGAHPRTALASATIGPHLGFEREALVQVRRSRRKAVGGDQVLLGFAEGDLHDRLGEHGRAWRAWRDANEAQGLRFDPDAHARSIDALIQATHELPTPPSEGADRRPVLVVGMPRSGTTLVERMLDGHPDAMGVGELEALRDVAVAVAQRAGTRTWLDAVPLLERWAPAIAGTYLSALARHAPDAARVVDKMPNNALHLGLVAATMGGARVVWCLRDPDDVALSCFSKPMQTGLPWTGSVAGIRAWQDGLERLRPHWQRHLGERMTTVRYEDLVAHPEREARRLVRHLGLPWHEAVLRPEERAAGVTTHSWDQVREPIHRGRVGRAAPYRPFLSDALKGAAAAS